MIAEVKLRLKTRMLGATRTKDKIRRFDKTPDRDIKLDAVQWMWALDQAAQDLRLRVDMDAIRLPLFIRTPTLMLYTDRSGKMYESIENNTILTFDVFLASVARPGQELPAPLFEELKQIFEHTGEHIGISPFGVKFGWGRFKIESMIGK